MVRTEVKNKTVTDQLWKDLHLENNEVLEKIPELKKKLYSMIHKYQDVFTNDQCLMKVTRPGTHLELNYCPILNRFDKE